MLSKSFFNLFGQSSFLNYEINEKLKQLMLVQKGIRAYDPKLKKTKLNGPLKVQIQTIDRCNASCVMCPYSSKKKVGPPNRMEKDLYTRILKELERIRALRSFTPMLQNEPLLDTKIAERVSEAKKSFRHNATVNIVTNGSLLDSKRINELIEAETDIISVSIDAYREKTYKSIHYGLNFTKVVNNVHLLLERKTKRNNVVVRFLKQQANKGEEKAFINYWRARGANVLLHSVVSFASDLLHQHADFSIESKIHHSAL